MERPTITIGAPVRDRGWILPEYLNHVLDLDYPKERITLIFIVNDSSDNTYDLLRMFQRDNENKYYDIIVEEYNQKAPKDERTWVRRSIYESLAKVRNRLLEMIKTDYLFSLDTDILVPSDSLNILLDSDKDIVAGVIRNDYIMSSNAKYPNIRTNLLLHDGSKYDHFKGFPLDSLFRVDITGAIYLMKREVCENVRYGYHHQGEDIFFCENAKAKGYEIWANSKIFAQHVMIVYQSICQNCSNNCKQVYIQDNKVQPKLITCPHKKE